MLYRSKGRVLTIEQQLNESLDDVVEELLKKFNIYLSDVSRTRTGFLRRPAVKITFRTKGEALEAEKWIEEEFEL